MAVSVRTGEWVEVTTRKYDSHKFKLKGQIFEVERTNVTTGELTIQTEELGRITLFNYEVKLALKPKVPALPTPPITPDNTVARIKSLVDRHQAAGYKIDRNFLEQILGKELLEQIFEKLAVESKDNICSMSQPGDICSINPIETEDENSDRLPTKIGGRPVGKKNNKPASGWLDAQVNEKTGRTNYYYCRRHYKPSTKKTKISAGVVPTVKKMMKVGYSVSQIEDLISEAVDF
ncbi:hypothetical protein [Okeania sp. SIO1I7]|uniref:hypothetical protein n=1 Tax=Okeania sp. SIO1I7 TaxID=2607772 RepID=UPI0013F90759|nr:hypothetical protein [Okeania sp. SIO1I7]NET30009.1 hypothetical protein [Okeania sp. SIO1I7]